ncbi:MAG: energy transducer TonB [Bacteroidia bacterium]|nr:energy transducer TonB [Bacteroidia bacterium]
MRKIKTSSVLATMKLILVLPVIILVLIAFSSCAARKKATTTQTEVAPPPPPPPPLPLPPPPPPAPQRPSRFEVIGNDTIYSYTREMPQFQGGNNALQKFKTENLKFPQEIKALGIEGFVMVRFMIEKNGSVSDVKIMQGVSPSLDAEAIRVTKLMPAWQPGKEKGKPVKFMSMTNFGFLITPPTPPTPSAHEEGTPFVVVEEMPRFPGGDSALLAYISQNTKYPESAKANNIEGRVIVRFCVTDSGGIDRVSVLKGVDPELDAEAIRVVKSLPKWKPGKQGGKAVPVWYMVPISFGLSKPEGQTATNLPPNAPPLPQGYDEAPQFVGGETALYKFINSKLVYPATAIEKKLSGKVNVRFFVNVDGSTGGVSVVKGISSELDAEAIRVVKLLPPWKPGKLAGTPVRVLYSIPVTFTLE